MTLIIGYSGRARSGKSESCEAIRNFTCQEYWNSARRSTSCDSYALSVPIQRRRTAVVYDIGNLIRLWCIKNGRLPQIERRDMTREQLQILIDVGKERRADDPNFWLDLMFTSIAFDAPDVALIPNLRYENEAAAVKAQNGFVVRMTRLNANGSEYISPDRDPNDISETSLQFWPADFYFTVKDGHVDLVRKQAVALYLYLSECGRYA